MNHCEELAYLHYLHATPNLEQRECTDELAVYLWQKCDFFFFFEWGWVGIKMRMRKAKILNHRVPVLS